MHRYKFKNLTLKTNQVKILLGIFAAAIVLSASFYNLTSKPAVWFDEGIFLHAGRTLADNGVFGVQLSPDSYSDLSLVTVGYPLLLPQAFLVKFFGQSIFGARVIMALFIIGFTLSFYLLVQRLYGGYLALAATLLLTTFAPLYGNGKSVIGEVPGLFYFTFGMFFMHLTEEMDRKFGANQRQIYAFLAGLGFGLAAATKPSFLIIAAAVLVSVIFKIHFWKKLPYTFLSGAIGFIAPLVIWVKTQFSGAINWAEMYSFYSNPYQLPAEEILNLLSSNFFRFFMESTPVHFSALLTVFLFFLIIKFKKKEKIYSVEIIVFCFSLLTIGAYLRTPGWYRYFFPAHVLLFIFLPAAVLYIVKFLNWRKDLAVVAVGLLLAVQFIHLGNEEWGYRPDKITPLGQYLKTIKPSTSVVFYNASELAYLYPNENFYQYIRINEKLSLGREIRTAIERGEYDMLISPAVYLSKEAGLHDLDYSCYQLDQTIDSYAILIRSSSDCTK
ncbi:MAG: glycosyltransferase family 39 protein [bacterium]|nr:glycosyltransferase family 39 protein [bacterium]